MLKWVPSDVLLVYEKGTGEGDLRRFWTKTFKRDNISQCTVDVAFKYVK